MDENDPENLVTLHSYLKREQYGSNPIFFGQYWNSFRLNETLDENGQLEVTIYTNDFEKATELLVISSVIARENSELLVETNNTFYYSVKYENKIYTLTYKINDDK